MARHRKTTRSILLGATALAGALTLSIGSAAAQERQFTFDLPAQPLSSALRLYARTAQEQVIFTDPDVRGRTAPALNGTYSADEALRLLLAGTDLKVQRTASGVLQVSAPTDPQSESAAGDGAEGTVEALIVTAQKREEDIQDVPIAISAFTQKDLEEQKIEGGFDLLKAIPNVTFSKNNFTSYNFSIRGIGTKAISATTDPGVAVSFNNIALIQNRLFEQEYFDVERVEVLRGPQGTLYGRNATAGVINVISAKPDMDERQASIKGEVGNYETRRLVGMVNLPVVEDVLAVRLAGAWTKRGGFDYNSITDNAINGRDLWSVRLTVGFEPTENIRSNLIWERFEEDDNRSRTGKQLCHRDDGPQTIDGASLENIFQGRYDYTRLRRALFAQGCRAGSLYDNAAFGTPNGLALPFVFGIIQAMGEGAAYNIGQFPDGTKATFLDGTDPYRGMMQSGDLRTVASAIDPTYRAKADLFELNVDIDLSDNVTLSSQTAYNEDTVYSSQDFNRFNTGPIFQDSTSWIRATGFGDYVPSEFRTLSPNGIFCDPQLGCSDGLVGFDISQAKGRQFVQELRLQSNFDGPVNFSVGANYTKFKTLVDYYVFYNLITAFALLPPFNGGVSGIDVDRSRCGLGVTYFSTGNSDVSRDDPRASCPWIDPNPLESISGDGHNYFRSKNPYQLTSAAAFGEIYWEASESLKLTAGFRYTKDRKNFTPVPSQVLLAPSFWSGGAVNRGYPELPFIKQKWGEWTGRLGVDLKSDLPFTDETMIYAFYSRGYKGGGANPPSPGFATLAQTIQIMREKGESEESIQGMITLGAAPPLQLTGVEYAPTFEPEFVDALEIGAKNTLLGGALTLNLGAFHYDYTDYQVSQIRDRTAVNENFDAKVWGFEVETIFAPAPNLRIVANAGYLDTKIATGETSIDIMNRTQGDPAYTLVKPWAELPSNCVVPTPVAKTWVENNVALVGAFGICGGWALSPLYRPIDPATGDRYDQNNYPELNGGAGLKAPLGGKELPNSPHWTTNIGVQYGFDIADGWRVTTRGDVYWQSQSWARVYNAVNDKLHGWYNVNMSVWVENDSGLKIELYAKNILDKTPITDAFLNSDDTALTTNVFVLDPRLIGLSVRKEF